MVTIRKLGKGQWNVRIRTRGWPLPCKTFSTKVLAGQRARQIKSEMDRGIYISRAQAAATQLQALDRHIVDCISRPSGSI